MEGIMDLRDASLFVQTCLIDGHWRSSAGGRRWMSSIRPPA
jgi:hypothetical protein